MKTVLADMTEEMVKNGKLTGEQAEQYASLKAHLTGAQEKGQNLAAELKKMTESGGGRQRGVTRQLKAHIKDERRNDRGQHRQSGDFVAGHGENDP